MVGKKCSFGEALKSKDNCNGNCDIWSFRPFDCAQGFTPAFGRAVIASRWLFFGTRERVPLLLSLSIWGEVRKARYPTHAMKLHEWGTRRFGLGLRRAVVLRTIPHPIAVRLQKGGAPAFEVAPGSGMR